MVDNKNNRIKLFINLSDDKKNSTNEKVGETFLSLEEQTYKIIKNKIIWHEIKMGERIIDNKLAEDLGVSRSMVRQILAILVKEELLIMVPRSGFYVRRITKKEIEEIYNIRKLLEAYATELTVPKICKMDIIKVEKVLEKAKEDLEKDEVKGFIEADAKLHKLFIDKCGNEYLKKAINKYDNQVSLYRAVDSSRVERAKKSYFELYEILKAAKQRKVKLSAELVVKHIETSKNIILDNFNDYTYG